MTDEELHKMAAVEASHWWYRGMRENCFAMMAPWLGERPSWRILDVGCGTGANLAELARLGNARGVDISPICVDYCRQKGLRADLGTMQDTGAAPESLDLITVFDVMTLLDPAENAGILRGLASALVPGGLLVMREPALPIAGGAHDRAVGIRQRFTRATLEAGFDAAGLTPLRMTYQNTLMFPAIVARRQFQSLTRPTRGKSDLKATGEPLNSLLLGLLRVEGRLLQRTNLPFGVSLFALARKTGRS